MRGKAFDGIKKAAEDRITPAHAGKSLVVVNHGEVIVDHPRACGEKGREDLTHAISEGSPPRMRGKVPA